ncbi:MAG: DUF4126 domain-containing protein [Planctomycetota bacterium]|nr:DUF4126 domain-containing protein [Planctomycetota bacterium]
MFFALALGLSLSICSGFRAIVPLFVLAVGHRFAPEGMVDLGANFEWLSSTPALLALSCAVIAETLADKIPAIDNLFDVIQTPLRTASGAAVVVAPFLDMPAWAMAILALIGGASALSVHTAKTTVRATSTATTGGMANPFISVLEDVLTWGLCLAALLIAPVVAVIALWILVYMLRKARRLFRRGEDEALVTVKEGLDKDIEI